MEQTYEDPVRDGIRVRQITPFLIVGMLALTLGALPPYGPDAAVFWVGAFGCFALVSLLMMFVSWYRLPVITSLIAVVPYCVAVGLLRAGSGGTGGEFGPLLIVPVVWMALYTSRSRMYLAIVVVFLALMAPIVVVGAPFFPATQWRYAVLFTVMAGTVGTVVKRLTTARTELVEQIRSMALTDPLTGLINRRGWEEVLAREAARVGRTGQPVTVALLDLDHCKRFNDNNGHLAGDRLLKATSWRQSRKPSLVPTGWLRRWEAA